MDPLFFLVRDHYRAGPQKVINNIAIFCKVIKTIKAIKLNKEHLEYGDKSAHPKLK
jgi:hypothetical protein